MYSPSLFVAVPVALFLVTCASPSAALAIGGNHNAFMKNKMMTAHSKHSKFGSPQRIRTKHEFGSPRRTRTKHAVAHHAQRRAVHAPADSSLNALLNSLTLAHGNILAASTSSAQEARWNPDDSTRQDTAAKLASYQQTLGPLYPLMANMGAGKGLANYDNSDQYETLLKDIVNANKYTLGDTSRLIDADPLLAPLLGPIVYDIKCILDKLLDYTENITDALLNSLAPLLKPLIGSATGTVCRSITPPVAGLCLPL
ncbi:hypothetical protein JB92DRAFT_485615 [Gautieria morchelliformis]|nr:hypothetical protein JB92DRAFT_485615 [Gautieria morchelliformis]